MPETIFEQQVGELENIARRLTADALTALARNVQGPSAKGIGWSPRDRYWFSGTAGVALTPDEVRALRKVWTRIQAALVQTHANVDVDALVRGRGIIARLDKLVRPDEDFRIQGHAAVILSRVLGKDVWYAVIGIWNAYCAGLLSDRLPAPLRADLEWSWRTALGDTPRELLSQGTTGLDPIRPLADQTPNSR